MRRFSIFIFAILVSYLPSQGQMEINEQSLFGNEWIDYNKTYYKVRVAEDALYKVSYQELKDAGIEVDNIEAKNLQVFYFGQEQAIYASTTGVMGPDDYLVFYGKKNRGEMDKHIIFPPDDYMIRTNGGLAYGQKNIENWHLNPAYSMYTDTSSYFITVGGFEGKRYSPIENTSGSNGLSPEPYYLHKEEKIFGDTHFKTTHRGGDKIRYSIIDFGEGFGSNLVSRLDMNYDVSNIYMDGPDPSIQVRFGGNSVNHRIRFFQGGRVIGAADYSGYEVTHLTRPMTTAELQESSSFNLQGTSSDNDRVITSYSSLTYPRTFNFDGESQIKITIPGALREKQINITGINTAGNNLKIIDLTTNSIIQGIISGDQLSFVLPQSAEDHEVIIVNEGEGYQPALDIQKRSFTNYINQDPEYIIISNQALFAHADGSNYVQDYADYRSSAEGGGYKTTVVPVDQLYDQFAYGIDRHCIGIKNFSNWVVQNLSNPEYFFIIGKGREYSEVRTPERVQASLDAPNFVPTFGVPGSDNLLVSKAASAVPNIPVGRIAARNADEVRLYLSKVRLHENPGMTSQTIEDQLWKKRIIHLSGGDPNIQKIIFNDLNIMKEKIESITYGANVTTFRKTSSDPIQTATSQAILDLINNGVSLITFFGHSAVGTFDFSLEEPSKYENFGRFPMIMSLGCYSGNIHTSGNGLSEDFVIEEEKAALCFLASSGSAYITPQYDVALDFYSQFGESLYEETVGKALQTAIFNKDEEVELGVKTLNQQLTYHGDPALQLNPSEGPDYVIDFESVKTTPTIVSTNLDSFDLTFDVVNLGFKLDTTLQVAVSHKLPNGEIAYANTYTIDAPGYANEVTIKVPTQGVRAIGKNTVLITVDSNNSIQEMPSGAAEENNELKSNNGEAGFCFFILDNGARPIFPQEYSIYTDTEIVLQASTNNAFLQEQNYLIEIDTTELFNSPLLQRTEILQEGGVIEWKPNITPVVDEVYYWRISPDVTIANIGLVWNTSSFIYKPNERSGWNQSDFFQFQDNDFDGIILTEDRIMEYDTSGFFISIDNKIFNESVPPGYNFNFETRAASVDPWVFMDEGVAIVVGDRIKGGALRNNGGEFGSINSATTASGRVFGFKTNTAEERKNVINFLENVIPNRDFVFFFTVVKNKDSDFSPELWAQDEQTGQSIYSILEREGATLVRTMESQGSLPYNFIYQKGVTPLAEGIAPSINDQVVTDAFIPVLDNNGKFKSTKIGPVRSWKNIEWEVENQEAQDQISISVIGVNDRNEETVIFENIVGNNLDISVIDPDDYPCIRVEMSSVDLENSTSPNLKYWRVFYDGFPEAAINTKNNFVFESDTIPKGQDLKVSMDVENISDLDMTELLVKYTITGVENQQIVVEERVEPLPNRSNLTLDFEYNTAALSGLYQYTVEINPDKDQPEQYSFNNFGIREFYVDVDNRNPLLDVTFDGVRIMNADLVSPTPFIVVELSDDNKFLLIDDPTSFEVALEKPDGSIWNIAADDPSLKFIPAVDGNNNKARIEFTPTLEDGEYKLFVQGKDASGNFSGDNAYEITFRVESRNTLSNIYNYPNPFSTSTQFIFTMTGQVPDVFTIQIMTLSGKVVKEITKEELGGVNIGINRTSYKWDGRDEFGDQLGNGVYLYRVVMSGDNPYENSSDSADLKFKDGFGKLVLMR